MSNILFVLPSWEERSLLGLQRDIEQNPNINHVVLLKCEFSINSTDTEKITSKIEKECEEKNIAVNTLIVPKDDIERWRMLDALIQGINEVDNIYIDITTMPRSIIWTLLFFCKQKYSEVTITYHKPAKYNEEWISKDPDIPQLLFKHSGIIELGKPTSLLILTGFDSERTMQLVNYYEPQNIILGIQSGVQFGNDSRNNKDKYNDLSKQSVRHFNVSVYDDNLGYEIIKKQVEEILSSSNLVIASLGPKPGAISVYQCYMEYPQIALAYVPCKDYNLNYCTGIGESLTQKISLK